MIKPDGASVEIVEAGAPSQLLTLREGLLPEVHYLPDGRHVLLATRSGWVLRLDLALARLVTELRVGTVSNGSVLSAVRADASSLLAVANAEPHTLVVLDEQLKLIKLLRAADRMGRTTSPVAKVGIAKSRGSFIVSFSNMPELWEISYNPKSPEIALGLVHDFQYHEGSFVPGYLNPQRSTLPSPATDFLLSESGNEVMTAHAESGLLHPGAGVRIQVVHLDVRRKIAEFMAPGWPVPGATFAADVRCGP
ncbi:cytochrome D1 domain-containing protein [Rhodoferax ferrireducens]|uniref:cytochrome D1 domain-containing protein n=1 Tax=Rhodoferax ferrireducens TaxID=192843 RepID=UPI00130065C7|nr:cytochrome D1 domain-containing protein [Rhodoferax ferrireducens]